MKLLRCLIFLLHLPFLAHSQAGEWIWMKGDNFTNSQGNFGTMGVPSASNYPPATYAPAFWTDTAGDFWIYGGGSLNGASADLWKFTPSTNIWTWMNGSTTGPDFAGAAGVFNAANQPGPLGYGLTAWVDKQNHLWMYGGNNGLGQENNNLWQYDPAINQWAWMNGAQQLYNQPPVYGQLGTGNAANTPGAREESDVSWVDSAGNLWLFSGLGTNGVDDFNDMWEYNISTNMWTWMSGADTLEGPGNYGPLGASAVNYYPSARSCNFYWQDSLYNFWLIGGTDFKTNNFYNDVWKFSPKTLKWTWVNGSQTPNNTNTPSPYCQPNSTCQQGGRYENRAVWKVCEEVVINYSGFQMPNGAGIQNDLWAYLPQQNQWMQINEYLAGGDYGTQGQASAQNYPPSRQGGISFMDKNKNLWMFGGANFESSPKFFNDLWKYVIDTTCLGSLYCNIPNVANCNLSAPVITSQTDSICPTDSSQICAPPGFSSYTWNNNTGAGTCIQAKQAGNYYVTVTDNSGCTAESNHISITVFSSPPVSISRSGDTLSVYNSSNVQWYLNNNAITGATQSTYIARTSGSYTVSVTDTNGCTSFSSPVIYTGIDNISVDEIISIYPNPLSVGGWQLVVGNNLIGSQVDVLDDNGRIVYKSEIRNPHSEINAQLPGGVYLLRITSGNAVVVRKLVKL